MRRAAGHRRWNPAERRADLVGIGNTITVGAWYDERKLPDQSGTFMRQIRDVIAADPMTLDDAEPRIDAWYRKHPEQLGKPIFAVLRLAFIKPHLVAVRE